MKYARDRSRRCRSVVLSGPSDDVARHAANDEERLEIAERWLARLQRMVRKSRAVQPIAGRRVVNVVARVRF